MYSYDNVYTNGIDMVMLVITIAIAGIVIAGTWKIFEKAGEPGWASLIPFYNTYTMFKIAWGNGWMFLLMLVPLANIVVAYLAEYKLAKAFGKELGFTLGLIFLPVIFIPMLGFGDSQYFGPQQ